MPEKVSTVQKPWSARRTAEVLGFHQETLYKKLAAGEFEGCYFRLGNRFKFFPNKILAWRDARMPHVRR